ncbi:unannotated protein [freshwater metagenome]|uniref:Unannotated protein n=1 Tax=freshwater metagenome TaxID=449393 RepID=A0A6J6CCC9_9ZZZZ
MITNTFNYGGGARVANQESLANQTAKVKLATGCAIADYVSGNDVVLGLENRLLRRAHTDDSARKTLTNVVIGVTE